MRAASCASLFAATAWAGSPLLLASAPSQQVTAPVGDEVLERLVGNEVQIGQDLTRLGTRRPASNHRAR
jgi:hypothetical protein